MAWREGDQYFLLLSKGHGGGMGYEVAYATSSSPTGPFGQWGVVFQSDPEPGEDTAKKVISPGATSVVRDGDGKTWMVYRQKTTTTHTFADRAVCIDRVTFQPVKRKIVGTPTKGVTLPAPAPLP